MQDCDITGCPDGYICDTSNGDVTCKQVGEQIPESATIQYNLGDEKIINPQGPSFLPGGIPTAIKGKHSNIARYNLDLDWNPSSCFNDSDCFPEKVVNAFTVYGLSAEYNDSDAETASCKSYTKDPEKFLSLIPQETRDKLLCIFGNAAGENAKLWIQSYADSGRCTGLDIAEYFDLVAKLYAATNLNRIVQKLGMINDTYLLHTAVNQIKLSDAISNITGARVRVDCDPEIGILTKVRFCFSPNPSFKLVDCESNSKCQGILRIPNRKGAIGSLQDECKNVFGFDLGSKRDHSCPFGSQFISSEGKCAVTSAGCPKGYIKSSQECMIPNGGMILIDSPRVNRSIEQTANFAASRCERMLVLIIMFTVYSIFSV